MQSLMRRYQGLMCDAAIAHGELADGEIKDIYPPSPMDTPFRGNWSSFRQRETRLSSVVVFRLVKQPWRLRTKVGWESESPPETSCFGLISTG